MLASKLNVQNRLSSVSQICSGVIDKKLEDLCFNLSAKTLFSHKVHKKIKKLKDSQDNTKTLILQSNIYVERKALISRLNDAIHNNDFLEGLKHIEAWNSLDMISFDISDSSLKTALPVLEFGVQLTNFQKLLQDSVQVSFHESNSEDFMAMISIFPKVKLSSVGLQIFCDFYKKQLAKKFEICISKKDGNFIFQLANIFYETTHIFMENLEYLRINFGISAAREFLLGLQTQSSFFASKVLNSVMSSQEFVELLGTILKNNSMKVDLMCFDAWLNDLMLIFQYSEEYFHEMDTFYQDTCVSDEAVPPSVLKNLSFFESIQDLLSVYIKLELFYLKENIKLALEIDKTEGNFISSSVDDIFYIFHKSACRSFGTGSVNAAVFVLKDIKEMVSGIVHENNFDKLKNLEINIGNVFSTNSVKNESDFESRLKPILYPVNNAIFVSEYVVKLKDELQVHAETLYKDSELATIEVLLKKFMPLSDRFENQALESIQKISEILLLQFSSFDFLSSKSYEFSEERYEKSSTSYDPWVISLLSNIEFYLEIFQFHLISPNFIFFVECMAESIAVRIESIIFSSLRFNQLGGLHFERELRVIISQISRFLNHSVREKFIRLTQIGMILSAESASEVFEYWEENTDSVIWHLTEGEIKRILSLRADFKKYSFRD